MAQKKKQKRTFFSRNKGKGSVSTASGSNEIYGLLIIVFGVLFFLALLSYYPNDPTVWNPGTANDSYQTQNWLRLFGSSLAEPVFQGTFGYAALVFPVLIIVLGACVFATYPLIKLTRFALLTTAWAYLGGIMLALPETLRTEGLTTQYFPSGLLGGITTDLLMRYGGRVALALIALLFFLILLMLTFQFRLSAIPLYFSAMFGGVGTSLANSVREIFDWLKPAPRAVSKPEKIPVRERLLSRFGSSDDAPEEQEYQEEEPVPLPAPVEMPLPPHEQRARSRQQLGEPPFEETFQSYEEPPVAAEPPEPPSRWTQPPVEVPPPAAIEIDNSSKTMFPERPPEALIPQEPPLRPEPELDFDNSLPDEEIFDYDEQVKEALATYQMPPLDLLHEEESGESKVSREELMANADLLENTLAQFGVKAFVKKVIEGPVITLYAVRPAEGVKINQVVSLADDLALAMRAKGIRMIAPIPGEAAIGIEIPNRRPSTVYFKSITRSDKFVHHKGQLVLGMGKTIGGDVFCADLARMPHLLIAGSTGSGKSVGVNTMIASILCRVPPSDVKFVMIDPKKLELSLYAKLKDHYLAICPDLDEIVITHPQNAIMILRSVVNEMEERYDILARIGVRDIIAYNKKIEKLDETGNKPEGAFRLPYIVVIIDELADLILTASREVEEPITRLAQMARAVGIHLIVATQRPSVDIITGLIKANFPTRIAYQVATRPDSKVILDLYGAEKLIGNGDMLFLPPGTGKPVRLQNPFVSTEEVESLIKHIRQQPKFPPYELRLVKPTSATEKSASATKKMLDQDDLFDQAREIVVRHQQGSISLLQRKLKVGYARAARLIDELETAGVVGPGQGSKARDVLVSAGFGNPE